MIIELEQSISDIFGEENTGNPNEVEPNLKWIYHTLVALYFLMYFCVASLFDIRFYWQALTIMRCFVVASYFDITAHTINPMIVISLSLK